MAYIYTDTENRLILGNEEYARKTNLPGSLWRKVRLCVRYCIQDTGSPIVTPTFAFGLSEGITNTFRGANTSGFLGVGYNGVFNWARSLSGNSGLPVYSGANNQLHHLQRTGSTTTITAEGISFPYQHVAPRGNVIFLDITRTGATTYTVGGIVGYNLTGGDPQIMTNYLFLWYAQQEILSTGYPPGYQLFGPTNLTYTGSSMNALDTLCVSWSKSTPPMEICDILLLRFV